MKQKASTNNTHYPGIPENLPCISIIIPFELRMNTIAGLNFILAAATCKEEKKLMKNYPADQAMPLIYKLRSLVKNLKYETPNMSIGIFISSLASKVYYFNYSYRNITNYQYILKR